MSELKKIKQKRQVRGNQVLVLPICMRVCVLADPSVPQEKFTRTTLIDTLPSLLPAVDDCRQVVCVCDDISLETYNGSSISIELSLQFKRCQSEDNLYTNQIH